MSRRIANEEIEAMRLKNLQREEDADSPEAQYQAALKAVERAERPEALAAIMLARLNPRVGGAES